MSLPYFRMYPTDYEAKTAHLSLIEDGAYNRLLRLCWMTPGCSLPDDEAWIMRRVRAHSDEEKEAVRFVLSEYFVRENQRVFNKRLMQEFEHAQNRHDAARENGMKGGRKPKSLKTNKTEKSDGLADEKQTGKLKKANQNQNQNYNNPPTPQGDDGFDLFWEEVPRKVGKGQAVKAYRAALKKTDAETLRQSMIDYAASVQGKDAQYIAHPSTWLNGERWQDELPTPQSEKTWRDKPESEWTAKDRADHLSWML